MNDEKDISQKPIEVETHQRDNLRGYRKYVLIGALVMFFIMLLVWGSKL